MSCLLQNIFKIIWRQLVISTDDILKCMERMVTQILVYCFKINMQLLPFLAVVEYKLSSFSRHLKKGISLSQTEFPRDFSSACVKGVFPGILHYV